MKIPHRNIILFFLATCFLAGCHGGGQNEHGGGDAGKIFGILAVVIGTIIAREKIIDALSTSNQKPSEEFEKIQFNPINISVYDTLSYIGNETDGFGLNTYVLFGARNPAPDSELADKYAALLSAISLHSFFPAYTSHSGNSKINKSDMNIFLVPVKENKENKELEKITLDTYNYDLSMYILHQILSKRSNDIIKEKFIKEGPFFIASQKTIQDMGKLYVLYVDMSTLSKENIREVILAYKKAISKKNNEKFDPFGLAENLRIQFAQKLINWNKMIGVIGKAYAFE